MYIVASGKASRLALGYALGYFVHKWYQFVVQYFTDYDTHTFGDSQIILGGTRMIIFYSRLVCLFILVYILVKCVVRLYSYSYIHIF